MFGVQKKKMKTKEKTQTELDDVDKYCCEECGRDLVWDNHREGCLNEN